MSSSFEAFGIEHLATLAAIFGVSILLPLAVNRLPGSITFARWSLGILVLATKFGELGWYMAKGVSWPYLLPLHLCDLAGFVLAFALFTRNRLAYELAYFWAMAGTLQALLTPDLGTGFPSMDYWLFFIPHGLVMVGVFVATGSLGLRPGPGCILRVTGCTLAVCVPAGLANWIWGTNYMYLREKPGAATLMDFLGPWPWYVLALVPVGVAFIALWYSPFWVIDRRKPKGMPVSR